MENKTNNEAAICLASHPSPENGRRDGAPDRASFKFPNNPATKFAWAGYQIREVTLGHTESIACPYCLSTVKLGVERLCCDLMGEATETVLSHIENEYPRNFDDLNEFTRTSASRRPGGRNQLVPISTGTGIRWALRIQRLVEG